MAASNSARRLGEAGGGALLACLDSRLSRVWCALKSRITCCRYGRDGSGERLKDLDLVEQFRSERVEISPHVHRASPNLKAQVCMVRSTLLSVALAELACFWAADTRGTA